MLQSVAHHKIVDVQQEVVSCYLVEHLLRYLYMLSLLFDNHPSLHLTVVQHAVSPQFLVAYAEAYLVSH